MIPDLDFLYYSNDMIGAGGLLWLLEQGYDIPGQIGLAGFNGLELLKGLPREAGDDGCLPAARSGAARRRSLQTASQPDADQSPQRIALEPKISYGDTLRRP